MKWLLATACAILISAPACGNGKHSVESPSLDGDGAGNGSDSSDNPDSHDTLDPDATADDPWKDESERPPGAQPIDPSVFVSFLGFEHGHKMTEIDGLLPATHAKLGKRKELDMAKSVGYKYESHLSVAWDVDTNRIEFLSVRSEEAIAYLAGQGRRDDNLGRVWNISPAVAHGLLGKPTQVVNRPHAVTYRYEFNAEGKRRGTVSLEFSKLADPVQCSAVSVHWFY